MSPHSHLDEAGGTKGLGCLKNWVADERVADEGAG